MPESIQNPLFAITGATFVLALLIFLVSWRLFRRSRTDVFWRRRREAGQRGWRLFLFGALLLSCSGVFCVSTALVGLLSNHEVKPTATAVGVILQAPSPTGEVPALIPTLGETSTPSVDQTPSPITPAVVIITATPVYISPTAPFPTFTPRVVPPVSDVTPNANARVVITALDDQISDALAPVSPHTMFDVSTTRLYLFIEFREMTPGVLWTHALYRNGELVEQNSYLWGSETQGQGYFFFGNDSGFAPGEYEIRLYVGSPDTPVSAMRFTVAQTS